MGKGLGLVHSQPTQPADPTSLTGLLQANVLLQPRPSRGRKRACYGSNESGHTRNPGTRIALSNPCPCPTSASSVPVYSLPLQCRPPAPKFPSVCTGRKKQILTQRGLRLAVSGPRIILDLHLFRHPAVALVPWAPVTEKAPCRFQRSLKNLKNSNHEKSAEEGPHSLWRHMRL